MQDVKSVKTVDIAWQWNMVQQLDYDYNERSQIKWD